MLQKDSFKKPDLWLEKHSKRKIVCAKDNVLPSIPDELWRACPSCKCPSLNADIEENLEVCISCGYHFTLSARQRIALICDEDSFVEMDAGLKGINIIDFPSYESKLAAAEKASGESEGVVCGQCKIEGYDAVICVMESKFIMGSMGRIVGEKITRAFEFATDKRLPVIVYTVSGGARMHEGIISLMQMAKTSGAVKFHSDAGLLYITFITNPTTGGVTASFAMEGDIILAEPEALIGFAGPRVIEQTIKQKLPKGFQSSEFLIKKGFLDAIVPRMGQKSYLAKLLKFHAEVH